MTPKLLKDSQTYALWGPDSSRGTSMGLLRSKGTDKETLLHRGEIQALQTKKRKDTIPTHLHNYSPVPQLEPQYLPHTQVPPPIDTNL